MKVHQIVHRSPRFFYMLSGTIENIEIQIFSPIGRSHIRKLATK